MANNERYFDDLVSMDGLIEEVIRVKMRATGMDYKAARQAVVRANPEVMRLREVLVRRREIRNPSPKVWRMIDGKPIEIDAQLERLAGEVMEEHPKAGYRQALRVVALQHGGLFEMREYLYQVLVCA